ncbi:MAG: glycosyltransferase [Parcubacteria group bacterium]
MKVVLIANIPSPYRFPVRNYLAEQLGQGNFKVLFMRDREDNRLWDIPYNHIKFRYEILKGWHWFVKSMEWEIHINFGLWPSLTRENPDCVIIDGYDSPSAWMALLWVKLHRRKMVLWSGSTLMSSHHISGMIGWLKKVFVRSADSYVTYGQDARDYLVHFGAKTERIAVGCNVCDINKFSASVANRQDAEFVAERTRYPSVLFLFVGQFIERKGVRQLLEAFKEIDNPDWGLILIGAGDLRGEVDKFIKGNGLVSRVFVLGYKQQNDIIKYYSLADIFVMPSLHEVYGIVASEALASGCFLLSSKYAGASRDLVKVGSNGFVFDPADKIDFIEKMKLAADKIKSGAVSRDQISASISKYTSQYYGQQTIVAIRTAMTQRPAVTASQDNKQAVKRILANIYALIFNLFRLRREPTLTILEYHSVNDSHPASILPEEFEAQLKWLKENRPVIRLSDWRLIERDSVALTFDDGFADNYDTIFPLLKKYNLPATFFVSTGFIDNQIDITSAAGNVFSGLKALTRSQLKEMAQCELADFGGHTHTHPVLTSLPLETAESEILQSQSLLSEMVGRPIDLFAYPKGQPRDLNGSIKKLLQKHNFKLACCTLWGSNKKNADPFALRRVRVDRSDTISDYADKISGAWAFVIIFQIINSWL